jgi:hemolysin activation/secretion protein
MNRVVSLACSLVLAAPLMGENDALAEVELVNTTHPVIKGVLLLGKEEDVIQEGVEEFSGLRAHDLKVPGGTPALQSLLEPVFLNQPLTDERLMLIKRMIILYYRDHGHPLMTVEVPLQDVTNGVVQLVVVESRLGKVVSKGNRWFPDRIFKDYIRIRPGEPIDSDGLLNDLSWMNQNPFHNTNVIYTPGEQPNTTDIELVTKDRIPWRLYGGGDNTGNHFTGNARWFAGFDWGNAFWVDHTFSFQGTTSTDLRRFRAVTFHYTAPLPWKNNLILYGGYSKYIPNVGDGFTAHGRNTQVSLRYEVPFLPLYESYLQNMEFGFDFKNTNNDFEFSTGANSAVFGRQLNITQFVGGYDFGWDNGVHKIDFQTLLFWSPGHIISHQGPGDFNFLRPHAKSSYVYQRFDFTWDYQLPYRFSLHTQARLQVANQNLVPSEQFGLGGYDTVRGYPERVLNVDNGFCFNFEFRFPEISFFRIFGKNKIHDKFTLLAFLDYGIGGNVHRLVGEPHSQYLLGVGPGLRYMIRTNVSVRADWGFKLHQLRGITHASEKTHVGVILNY